MNILLTSGGTKVKIDRVRHIGNMSRGTFGAAIARSIMLLDVAKEASLTFLASEGSRLPYALDANLNEKDFDQLVGDLRVLSRLHDEARDRYKEITYKGFADYAAKFSDLLSPEPDVVLLAAAVSDYTVKNYVNGKIRSKGDMRIDLEPAPKIIGTIRARCPNARIIGFKLLVDSTDDELIAAAQAQAIANDCEVVVANDLRDIQANDHRLLLVTKDGLLREERSNGDSITLPITVAMLALEGIK